MYRFILCVRVLHSTRWLQTFWQILGESIGQKYFPKKQICELFHLVCHCVQYASCPIYVRSISLVSALSFLTSIIYSSGVKGTDFHNELIAKLPDCRIIDKASKEQSEK